MNENIVIKFIADNGQFNKATDQMTGKLTGLHKTARDVARAIELGAVGGLALLAAKTTFVKNAWGSATSFLTNTLGRLGFQAEKVMAGITHGSQAVAKNLLGISTVGTIVEKALIGAGIGIVASMGFAVKGAASFEEKMANVQSIVRASPRDFAALSAEILKTARTVPQEANSLAEAAYAISSAGFTRASDQTKLISATGKAATAGLTDSKTAALSLVTTLNAYGLSANNAGRVSDVLFQIVRQGQTDFGQLSENLAQFIGIAHTSGASLEETGAAYSAITTRMGDANRAATALQAIFRSFINPSKDMTALLKDMGFATGVQAIQTKGLQPLVTEVTKRVGGQADQMYRLFQNVEAYNGVAALNAQTATQQAENLAKFTDKAKLLGTTQSALNEQSKSWNYQLKLIKTSLGATSIEMGQAFLPVLKLVTEVIGFFIRDISSMPKWLKETIAWVTVGFGALLTFSGAWALVTTRLKTIKVVMAALADTPVLGWLKSQITTLPILGDAYESAAAKAAMLGTASKVMLGVGIFLGVTQGTKALERHNSTVKRSIDGFIGMEAHIPLVGKLLAGLDQKNFGVGDSSKKASNDVADFKDQQQILAETLSNDTLDAFTAAEDAVKKYDDAIRQAVSDAQAFLGLPGILSDIDQAHQDAANAAKSEGEAIDGITAAQDKLNAAKDKEVDAQKRIDRLRYITNNAPIVGTDTAKKLADAERDLRDAKRDQTKATADSNAESKKTPATLAEVTAGIQKQIDSYQQFNSDLDKLAMKGLDPAAIDELKSMGKDGVDLAHQLATAPPKEFDKAKGLLAEKAREQGEDFQRELDKQLKVAEAIGRVGAHATVEAILDEVTKLAPGLSANEQDVRNAGLVLGVAFGQGYSAGVGAILGNSTSAGSLGGPGTVTAPDTAPGATTGSGLAPGAVGADTLQRDRGGPLPPGYSTVYNGTGRSEWVFTADQMHNVARAVSAGNVGGTRVDRSTKISVGTVTAHDYNDFTAQMERRARLAAMAGQGAP